MDVEFFDDAATFLEQARGALEADPVVASVIASVTARAARTQDRPGHPQWWVLVREEGEVVGVAMRTAPFAPHPMFFAPMPDDAAVAIAQALNERGEHPGGCNGALPAAQVCAEEVARLFGGRAVADQATRLFECREVVPAPAAGTLRLATYDDADLCLDWYTRFGTEADEQAGRTDSAAGHGEHHSMEDIVTRIDEGVIHLVEVDGEVVHLTGSGVPAFGVGRIGPVFTPKEHRGRGYASYAVGELTRRGLEAGHRMCLYTDRANPTSNKIYEALGYRAVCDQANVLVVAAD